MVYLLSMPNFMSSPAVITRFVDFSCLLQTLPIAPGIVVFWAYYDYCIQPRHNLPTCMSVDPY